MAAETKKVIAVTGMNGQLGRELAVLTPLYPKFRFHFLSRETFPLDQPEIMEAWMNEHPVDFFINCAAYTGVDQAESDKEKAFKINAEAPGIIARLMQKNAGRLIQISTDYVFDGSSATPLKEDAGTHPVNTYGLSKRKGEEAAVANNPQTLIIRTSWLYSAFGNNFVKTMVRLMSTRESIQVVQDQQGSPTFAADLARAILDILSAEKFIPGIYHYSNEGETSWFAFALEIKKLTGSSCTVHPVDSSGYPTAARRPAYSLLDKSKIKRDYHLVIPDWKTSLAIAMKEILKQQV
jgi:dTDP-4-dehydrorhamnose reductase